MKDMVESKEIEKVLVNVDYYLNLKPLFLKTTEKHNTIWKRICVCNSIISLLIDYEILRDDELSVMINSFELNLSDILKLCSKSMELLVGNYYLTMFEYLMSLCLENELYESCENIKIFVEKYTEPQ